MQESKGKTMMLRNEPTIGELMADPLIRSVMRADRVDAQAFEAMLHALARRVAGQREAAAAYLRRPPFEAVPAPSIASPPPLALLAKMPKEICGPLCSW
jgi:hypothetical protein